MATASPPDNVIRPFAARCVRIGPRSRSGHTMTVPENQEANDGRSQEEDLEVEDTKPSSERLAPERAGSQLVPAMR